MHKEEEEEEGSIAEWQVTRECHKASHLEIVRKHVFVLRQSGALLLDPMIESGHMQSGRG